MPSTSELPSLVLVCPSNCGSRTFTWSTQVSPSRMSSPESVKPSFLRKSRRLAHVVDGPGERRLEAGEVGAALVGVDVVDEGEGVLVVPVLVLEGELHLDVVLHRAERDRLGVQRLLVPVEPLRRTRPGRPWRRTSRSFVWSSRSSLMVMRDALVQERELAQPVGQGGVVELEDGEDLGIGLEPDRGARALASCRGPRASSPSCRGRRPCGGACRRGRTTTSSRSESALTTDTPTPCRPPDTL